MQQPDLRKLFVCNQIVLFLHICYLLQLLLISVNKFALRSGQIFYAKLFQRKGQAWSTIETEYFKHSPYLIAPLRLVLLQSQLLFGPCHSISAQQHARIIPHATIIILIIRGDLICFSCAKILEFRLHMDISQNNWQRKLIPQWVALWGQTPQDQWLRTTVLTLRIWEHLQHAKVHRILHPQLSCSP